MSRIPAVILCSALALPAVALAKDHDDRPRPQGYHVPGPPPHAPAYGYRGWVPPPRPLPPPYYGYRRPPPVYVYRPAPLPVYGYRPYPPPCYGYGCYPYKHKGDNDDAWWALGGLVAGVIIGTAIDGNHYAPPPPPPPPPPR